MLRACNLHLGRRAAQATSVFRRAHRGLAVSVGDDIAVPDVKLQAARNWDDGVADGFKSTTLEDLFKGKKLAVFAVPGAYTGVCSNAHVPSFVENANAIKAKGVDQIVCVSVNDPYTMAAWGSNFSTEVTFFGDSDASFAEFMGQALDLNVAALGPGKRSNRFSMVVDDGKVVSLNVEEAPADLKVSDGATLLASL